MNATEISPQLNCTVVYYVAFCCAQHNALYQSAFQFTYAAKQKRQRELSALTLGIDASSVATHDNQKSTIAFGINVLCEIRNKARINIPNAKSTPHNIQQQMSTIRSESGYFWLECLDTIQISWNSPIFSLYQQKHLARLFLFSYYFRSPSYMIESPRWLIIQGDYKKAVYYLNRIARINKKPVILTEDQLRSLMPISEKGETTYGMLSLFSGKRLARNSIFLIIAWWVKRGFFCWTVHWMTLSFHWILFFFFFFFPRRLVYFWVVWNRMICAVSFSTLTLYVQQAAGNPFLNFFGQSIAEAPAHIVGTILVDRIGRRLTNSSSSLMAAVFCLPAIFYCTCMYHSNYFLDCPWSNWTPH